MSDTPRLDSYFPKKLVGLELLQNPHVSKKTSFTFQPTPKETDTTSDATPTDKTQLFCQMVQQKLAGFTIPLRPPDRSDPVLVMLEATYYQYYGQQHFPQGFSLSTQESGRGSSPSEPPADG